MMELSHSYGQEHDRVQREDGCGYPARSMSKAAQTPAFDRAKMHLLPHIRTINQAHLIMLKEQRIIHEDDAAAIMAALEALDDEKYRRSTYTGKTEDIYFEMESELIDRTHGVAGNLHLARSRNDMCIAWVHMMVRDRLLRAIQFLIRLRNTFYLLGEEHKDTLYVIHTHTQHAQPGVLGLYFLAAGDMIGRDLERMRAAYARVNQCPMGAAAIATTGFPISRRRVAELSGFDGIIENAYDAISNMDMFTDTGAAIAHCALDLSRVVTDLILWATQEQHMIKLADGYISTSSIMPQKRNPIALEHLRSALSVLKGFSDAMALTFFKTPYGDIVDHDGAEDALLAAFDKLEDCLVMLNAVVATMEVDKALLNRRAHESFSVVTEIADQMYRAYGIPFRDAHHFVAYMVRKAGEAGFNLKSIDRAFFAQCYEAIFHQAFQGDFTPIEQAMDPLRFVACREVEGGTGQRAMAAMIAGGREKIAGDVKWLEAARGRIRQADEKRAEAIRQMLS